MKKILENENNFKVVLSLDKKRKEANAVGEANEELPRY